MQQHCSVVIVGAGESGIAVGCMLKQKLGITDFRIIDRQGGIGGAWYINSPALFYSYSFAPNYEWTSLFPPGEEIAQYLVSVCKRFNIIDNIQLNTEVVEARWLPDCAEWEVRFASLVPLAGDLSDRERQARIERNGRASVYLDGENDVKIIRSKVLITCAGELAEPKIWPKSVPGIDTFQGDMMHSARWQDDVDLADKDVVVVGTGCTSAQLVPSLLKMPTDSVSPCGPDAGKVPRRGPKHVTQLMRTAPWLIPRPSAPPGWFNNAMAALQAFPALGRLLRVLIFLYAESTWLNVGMDMLAKARRQRFQRRLLDHIRKMVPQKYHEMLTPNFGVGCKRIIVDGGWLECLGLLDRMELTTRPLLSVGVRDVVLGPLPGSTKGADGEDDSASTITKHADVIILANGFDTSTYLHRITVRNGTGKSLHDVWADREGQNGPGKGGPGAYLSTAVHGFPNFFIILGPCSVSGHSSAILASENVAGYALNFVRLVLSGEARTVEVKQDAERRYTADVQRRSASKVWQTCRGGYITEAGWNSSICPYNQIHFTAMCSYPRWHDWDVEYTAHGMSQQTKLFGRRLTWTAVMIALFVLVFILAANRRGI